MFGRLEISQREGERERQVEIVTETVYIRKMSK